MNDTILDTDPPNPGDEHEDAPELTDEQLAESEIIVEEPDNKDYPWTTDPNEMLRSFIFQTLADADYSVETQIPLMDAAYEWIKNQIVPEKPKKSHLKPVKAAE